MTSQAIEDFLLFRTTISAQVLIVVYYLGAIGVPFASLWMARRLSRYWGEAKQALRQQSIDVALPGLPVRYRWRVWAAGIAMFLLMELGWRMLIEYLIAFMHMHEALLKLSGQ